MKEGLDNIKSQFDELVLSPEVVKGLDQEHTALQQEYKTRLMAQLNINLSAFVFNSQQLGQSSRVTLQRAEEAGFIIVIGIVAILTIAIGTIVYLVGRSIFGPIAELQEGAKAIGAGNLDTKVAIRSKDEIGDLALAFNQMGEQLKASSESLSLLYSVSTEVSRSLEIGVVLRKAMHMVLEKFNFTVASIYLFDEERKELCLIEHEGHTKHSIPPSNIKVGQQIAGTIFETGEPLFCEDIQNDPEYHRLSHRKEAMKAGLKGAFFIPIKNKGKSIGEMSFFSKRPHRFPPKEVELILSIADHVGIALENARLYERTKVQAVQLEKDIIKRKQAEEELKHSREQLRNLAQHIETERELERAQIARNLHDDLGQSLAALKFDLSWLSKRLPEYQSPLLKRTASMSQLIDSSLRRVREISTELRPRVLDDFGLPEAISWQAQVFQSRTDIKCELMHSVKDIPLDRTQSVSLFRIFQESLTNVALHTHATEIKVNLESNTDRVLLEIKDNGSGITNSQISSLESLGIQGMRERVIFLGGEFNINGIKGKGTTVSIRVPLDKSEGG